VNTMAVEWFSQRSSSLVLVLLLAICLNISSILENLLNDGNLIVALKLNSISFPGSNSGLPRR